MESFAASSRLPVVRFCWYLLILFECGISTCRCFGFVDTIHRSKNNANQRLSYDNYCSKLHMTPSLDDAALFGKNIFQVVIDASPIGLPIAGLAAAFVLSKSGIQQREDLRTEVEQVQTNIIKKSEEAAIAGKASQTFLAISVLSTLLSIGNVATMLPTTKDRFESNTNQVEKQIVLVPTPTGSPTDQHSIELDDKPVPSEILTTKNARDEFHPKDEIFTITQTTTDLQVEDSKKELFNEVKPPSIPDIGATSPHEILLDDENNDLFRITENDPSQIADKTTTQQTIDIEVPTIAGFHKQENAEAVKDSLLAALYQYRTQGSINTMTKQFVREILDLMKVWVQSTAATIASDPVMISMTEHVKDSNRIIEVSAQVVNDRLPSDSQPFVKGFLVGTLLLNVFNEGQKYKEEVYTMYSDENVNARILNNETDVNTSEPLILNDGTDYAIGQPWMEETETESVSKPLDNEKGAIVDEVQALAEVLISKKIVRELLQKKNEKQKPYFASSIMAIADQQSSPLPQPPMEKPSIELFDVNVRALVDKLKRKTDGLPNLSDSSTEQLMSSIDASPLWTAPFLRRSPNNSRDEKYVTVGAEMKTNAFILWMKDIAKLVTEKSTEKALDTTSKVSSFVNLSKDSSNSINPDIPDTLRPKLFINTTEDTQRDSWLNSQRYNTENEFLRDYDFTSPSKVDKIFDSDEFLYGKFSAQDEASESGKRKGNFIEQENFSISTPNISKLGTESFKSYSMQINNESQQLERKEGEQMAPFNIPVSESSATSTTQWPPPMKRTSYSSIGEGYGGKDEVKAVEFNAPFDTYEYQYARYSGGIPGSENANTASAETSSKFEFTAPVDYEPTFSALNIYSSETTPNLNYEKADQPDVKPSDQPALGTSNNFEYTDTIPIDNNGSEESRKFEFPAPSKFEPTFSALSIYGEPSAESPPESDSNLDTKFQSKESVEPILSDLRIYSVTPESNDVTRVSKPEKLYPSVEAQSVSDPKEVYNKPLKGNQEYPAPGSIDSESSSEPSFSLADLFNETTAFQDTDQKYELQEALSIPIVDVLPPSFQVDIEVAESLPANPYDNVNMFSILPDMNDIFSAKPSYNPYPTYQPDELETNDLRKDAIDTPNDSNPTYHDKSDAVFVLPQEVSITTTDSFNEPRNVSVDLPLMNQNAESIESRIPEHEELNELTIHELDSPVVVHPPNSENGTALVPVLLPQEGLLPQSSNESTTEDLLLMRQISIRDEEERSQSKATTQSKHITDNQTNDTLRFPFHINSTIESSEEALQEFPLTLQNTERLDETKSDRDGKNDLTIQATDTLIDTSISNSDNAALLSASLPAGTSSKSDSTHSDGPSAKNTETNESENDTATIADTNATIQDNFTVMPQKPEKTVVSSTQLDSEIPSDNEYVWDEEPFQ